MKTQETLTAVAGALSVASSAMGTTSRSRVSTSRGTSYVTTHTYSPAATGLTALAASARLNSLVTNNKLTLDILESTLLYSSNIAAKNNYTGNVYLDADNSSPDYKVTISNDDGTSQDFIFSRSDRYEVLHP